MRFRLAVAGLAVVSVFPLAGCKPKNAPMTGAPPGAKPVTIAAKCKDNGRVSFSIDSLAVTVEVDKGQSVWWAPVKVNGKNDVTVTIAAADKGSWPFPQDSIKIDPESDGVSSGAPTSPGPGTRNIKYNIVFECAVGGQSRRVVIDPDIIIFDG